MCRVKHLFIIIIVIIISITNKKKEQLKGKLLTQLWKSSLAKSL